MAAIVCPIQSYINSFKYKRDTRTRLLCMIDYQYHLKQHHFLHISNIGYVYNRISVYGFVEGQCSDVLVSLLASQDTVKQKKYSVIILCDPLHLIFNRLTLSLSFNKHTGEQPFPLAINCIKFHLSKVSKHYHKIKSLTQRLKNLILRGLVVVQTLPQNSVTVKIFLYISMVLCNIEYYKCNTVHLDINIKSLGDLWDCNEPAGDLELLATTKHLSCYNH